MYLIAGLGNPGARYRGNRHNVGFMVIERLAERARAPSLREKHKGLICQATVGREAAQLLMPQTYMNLSGESLRSAMDFYKVPVERIVVIHDELDLPFATLRLKKGGGAGGHNGLKSIIQHCGADFLRLRVGIGRPGRGNGAGASTESYVLSDFSHQESAALESVLQDAALAVEHLLREGVKAAMNRVNVRPKAPKAPPKAPKAPQSPPDLTGTSAPGEAMAKPVAKPIAKPISTDTKNNET